MSAPKKTLPPPAEMRRLWVAALRSRKYTQAQNILRGEGNQRCCLGVACDVYRAASGRGRWDGEGTFRVSGDGNMYVLPEPVRAALGLKTNSGDTSTTNGFSQHLAHLNDSGTPFAEIATLIESGKVLLSDEAGK